MDSVQDLMVNVDLSNSQYNLKLIYEEAQKLGMDIDDLKEYGFDERAMNCGNHVGVACKGMDQTFG
jgi:hypothetical protein